MQDTWIDSVITRLLVAQDRDDAARELSARIEGLGSEGFVELIRHSRICHPQFRSESYDSIYLALKGALHADNEWRYGPNRIRSLVDCFKEAHEFHTFAGASILEIGCGPQHPLGTTAVYYMNGAAMTTAVDLEPVLNESRSATALLDLVMEVLAFPAEWNFTGISEDDMLRRARAFDLARLREGHLQGSFNRTSCEYKVCDLRTVIQDHRSSFDVVLSNAVMEHVNPFEEFAALFYEAVKPGGIMFHNVDFIDHRWYLGLVPSRFEYMRNGGGTDLFNVNQLRCSQMEAMFQSAGFRREHLWQGEMDVPEDVLQDLKPEYRTLPPSDHRTIQAIMVYRKTGQ